MTCRVELRAEHPEHHLVEHQAADAHHEELEELRAHRPRGAERPPAVEQVVVDHGDGEGQTAGEGLDGERRGGVELLPGQQRELEHDEVDDSADGADHGELHELLAAPVETFVHVSPGSARREEVARRRSAGRAAGRPRP